MLRTSKIPLPEDEKSELLGREASLTYVIVGLAILLVFMGGLFGLDRFVISWLLIALFALLALLLVSQTNRKSIGLLLAGLLVCLAILATLTDKMFATVFALGGGAILVIYATYLGRKEYVRQYRKRYDK